VLRLRVSLGERSRSAWPAKVLTRRTDDASRRGKQRATRSSASNSLSYARRRPPYLMTSLIFVPFGISKLGGIKIWGCLWSMDSSADGWLGASTITTSVRPGVRP